MSVIHCNLRRARTATAKGRLGGYYLKGGVAMELRFAHRARATNDLDLVLDGRLGNST